MSVKTLMSWPPDSGQHDWSQLACRVRGRVTTRQEAEYDARRNDLVWNGAKPRRFPDAIVRVADDGDVRETVLFCRERGLKVAVRGGGHNWNGTSVRDGGVVIDLSDLNRVDIDVEKRRAVIQPVVSNKDMAAELLRHNLAFPVGHCPQVCASGYLMSGGLGLNTPHWGPGCAQVEAIHVVNAKGESLVADATRNSDLFWAARGGGPDFPGVITRYVLKVHPIPRAIRQSAFCYHLDQAQDFADWLSEVTPKLNPCVESMGLITTPPYARLAHGLLPRSWRSRKKNWPQDHRRSGWFTYVAMAFADSKEEAEQWLAPFASPPPGPKPVYHDHMWRTSFQELNWFTGLLFPEDRYYSPDMIWTDCPVGKLMELLSDEYQRTLDVDSFIMLALYQDPPASLLPAGSAAFSMSSQSLVGLYATADNEEVDRKNKEWVARMRALLEPHIVGLYVGEADLEAYPHRAQECYSPEAWAKLQAIKKQHDPDDLFYGFLGATESASSQ